jgi:DNA-binding transcriptional MerR regulator
LRAWQRRYGLINPQRSQTGHRSYSNDDIATIKTILGWLDKGVAIRNVKPLLTGQHKQQLSSQQLPEVEQLLDALAKLHADQAEFLLATALKEYPLVTFKKRIFIPIEAQIKSLERPHRGLQYALWRTLMTELLSGIVSQQRKKNRRKCWLIRCGHRAHTLSWLTALELSNKGDSVTVIDGIQESLSPFVDLIDANQRTKVVIVGDEKLTPAIIKELQRLPNKPILVGSIATIHASDFR